MPAANAEAKFTPDIVALLTGVSQPSLNQLYGRNVFPSSCRDSAPTGQGNPRLVCKETIYNIAIWSGVTKLNIPAKPAAKASWLFAAGQPDRQASQVFEFGRTLLLMTAAGSRIINAGYDDTLTDIVGRPLEPAVILDLGPIIKAVDTALSNIRN